MTCCPNFKALAHCPPPCRLTHLYRWWNPCCYLQCTETKFWPSMTPLWHSNKWRDEMEVQYARTKTGCVKGANESLQSPSWNWIRLLHISPTYTFRDDISQFYRFPLGTFNCKLTQYCCTPCHIFGSVMVELNCLQMTEAKKNKNQIKKNHHKSQNIMKKAKAIYAIYALMSWTSFIVCFYV